MICIYCLELALSLLEFVSPPIQSTRGEHVCSTAELGAVSVQRGSLVGISSEIVNCDLLIYYLSWVSVEVLTSLLHIALILSIIF